MENMLISSYIQLGVIVVTHQTDNIVDPVIHHQKAANYSTFVCRLYGDGRLGYWAGADYITEGRFFRSENGID